MKPKNFNNKGKQNTPTTIQHDLGSDSGDETKITAMGFQGKDFNAVLVLQVAISIKLNMKNKE